MLVESEVLLALAPRLTAGLCLHAQAVSDAWPEESAEEAQQRQQHAAGLVGRLGAQLAQCSALQELSIQALPAQLSLELATELLVLAPQLQRLAVTAGGWHTKVAPHPAAAAALGAALAARHHSRPDAAARALHVTTDLVSEQGAAEVMWALGRVGVRGVRVVYGCHDYD